MLKPLLAATLLIGCVASSKAQLKTPAPSTTQTIKQDFGVGSIELSYSRPGMKTRKIFGELVPFNKVWRTGANQATTLTFTDSVTVGTQKIAPGKYGLLSIPNKDEWTMIITKQLDVTSPAAYKQENDVVRLNVKPTKIPATMETFTMQFANVAPTSVELHLMWENTDVSLPISTDYDRKVLASINQSLADSRPFYQAAMYYLETGKDLDQAIAWFHKATDQNPNAYWVYHQLGNALAKRGKKEEARAAATKSLELARQAKNDDYVKLNETLLASLK